MTDKYYYDNLSPSLKLIWDYGGIDGAHHKQWLLDQILRLQLGVMYPMWVDEYENLDENGDREYTWDVGSAP